MLPVPAHMPFTDVCSTVSCWALILSVIFPPTHVLALDLISTPTHTHSQTKHIKDTGHHHHLYRISPSSAYSLTVHLDSALHSFSTSVSPTLLSPTPPPSSSLVSSSSSSSPEKSSAPLRCVRRHTTRAQGSVKRSHISTVLLPPSPQKQEKVHLFPSSKATRTTIDDASAQLQGNNQAHRPDRQKMSDRNIIKKQTIYIANSNNEQKDEQISHVRVSRGQIRRLIRHQSSTDQCSQHPQRQWSQILDIFWNTDTFQDTTTTPAFQNDRHTRHHHHQTQQQQQQEQEHHDHDHAYDSQSSDNNTGDNNNSKNWVTETEEENESGLWHGYVYPTGWNESTFNNDFFPLSVSNLFFAWTQTHTPPPLLDHSLGVYGVSVGLCVACSQLVSPLSLSFSFLLLSLPFFQTFFSFFSCRHWDTWQLLWRQGGSGYPVAVDLFGENKKTRFLNHLLPYSEEGRS